MRLKKFGVILSIVFLKPALVIASANAWTISTIDSTDTSGEFNSIAVGTSGAAYISYRDVTNANLMYATNVSGSWGTSTLDSTGDVGQHTSIAVGTSGAAYISYRDSTNGYLKYATNLSSSSRAS